MEHIRNGSTAAAIAAEGVAGFSGGEKRMKDLNVIHELTQLRCVLHATTSTEKW